MRETVAPDSGAIEHQHLAVACHLGDDRRRRDAGHWHHRPRSPCRTVESGTRLPSTSARRRAIPSPHGALHRQQARLQDVDRSISSTSARPSAQASAFGRFRRTTLAAPLGQSSSNRSRPGDRPVRIRITAAATTGPGQWTAPDLVDAAPVFRQCPPFQQIDHGLGASRLVSMRIWAWMAVTWVAIRSRAVRRRRKNARSGVNRRRLAFILDQFRRETLIGQQIGHRNMPDLEQANTARAVGRRLYL